MEWPLMSRRRYNEVKAQLDFTNAHLMEAICTARSLERLMGELLVSISLKHWEYSPAARSRIKDLRKTFQKQINSIVKGTRWPSKPATLARQLQQLDSKKQQLDPCQQLQDALQDNHMLLEKLASEQQRSAKVEEELRVTCDRERKLEDSYDNFVEFVWKQLRAEDEAANAQRQEELVRQAVEAQQETSRLQRLTADQAAQIATLLQQSAAAQKAKSKAQRRFVVLAEAGAAQFQQLRKANEQVGELSLKVGAAEQLNKQLQQENAELQEALDQLRSAGYAAEEPGTPMQRSSSSSSRMFSCSG